MDNLKVLFGKKIKELRTKRGYTQSQLAEFVNVDNKHISCIESGKNFPSPDLIERLAFAFKVEPKELFEFYHLQNVVDLKEDILSMVSALKDDELVLAHKYIRTFLLK